MSWSTITAAEFVLEGFNADERAKLQTASGGDDGLATILSAAIAEWRGVMQAADYPIDETSATTIPPSCRRHIIAQCRWQVLIKFPALRNLQTEERKAAADEAKEKLAKIEDRKAAIESPLTPATDPLAPGRIETITDNTRQNTRTKFNGL